MLVSFFKLGLLLIAGCVIVSCETFQNGESQEFGAEAGVAETDVPEEVDEGGRALEEPLAAPVFEDPGGDLELRALTQMAQANSPVFAEAEANLRVARARRKTAWEWRDPQFRGGFDWDDVRIGEVSIPGPGNNDAVRRNEDVVTRVRLYPPNPFQVRAEINKSMAEISYAEYYLRQVGRDLVQEVRRLYQELQFLQENIKLGKGIYRLEMEEYERLKALLAAGQQLRDPVDRQQLVALNRKGITSSPEIRFQQVRGELAALVGLADPNRISVTGVPDRPIIGFRDDTVASLSEMAFMNNLKLADLDRLQSLAEGDLQAFKAKRIPWISFIEGGRSRSYSRHLAINDNWSIRLAIDVPIFSMFSKEGDIYREQIQGYQKQANRYRLQIQRQISSAVANIREARMGVARFDKETGDIVGALESIEAELAEVPQRKADLIHRRRTTSMTRSRERLEAEQAYHDALLNLETIIREDIEAVFRERGSESGE